MEKAQIRIIRSKRKTVALEIRPDLSVLVSTARNSGTGTVLCPGCRRDLWQDHHTKPAYTLGKLQCKGQS